ncbi:hypothetical protein GGR55DRAFT_689098 [Xylaria sp. FL0064]|nr:hypothetical protein GGR55DRAFT_689098 [Xylaria sp. FL0064]
MANPTSLLDELETKKLEGRVIIRRFTDQLAGANELERSTKAAQEEIEKEDELEETRRLKVLYESPADYSISGNRQEALQRTIGRFSEDAKPSMLQRMGISSSKSSKTKATELLEDVVHGDFTEIKASVNNLETTWKESHGSRICGTLDDHRNILAIFLSEDNYTPVLAASFSCLMKSVASISDKVATCSGLIVIIKTQRLRKKLANIYARMFEFYRDVIKWYLQSRSSRVFSSFNDNLKKGFNDATKGIEDCIKESYREAYLGSVAMVAILNGKDTSAGRRMLYLMEAILNNSKLAERLDSTNPRHLAIESTSRVQDVDLSGITRAQARTYCPMLKPFIIGDEGSGLFGAGSFWLAEEEVLPKLRTWMIECTTPRTLWAETPLISHFCRRPQPGEMRPGMSMAQAGLVGLVYSLIHQLLQFSATEDSLDISAETLTALDGSNKSWGASLEVLRALLDRTPVLMYCVIDRLNDLEWGDGAKGCQQVLDVLFARQGQAGTVFNVLLTTTGQSRVLPSYVKFKDRHIATNAARAVARYGRRIELQSMAHGPQTSE